MFRSLECDVRQLPASLNGELKVVGPAISKHLVAAEPPRRRREKRSKEPPPPGDAANEPVSALKLETIEVLAAAAPSPVFAAVTEPPPTIPEASAPIAEPAPASNPDRRHRADPPHDVVPARLGSRRHRWSAEEFEGELADQVNAAFASAALGDGKPSARDSD
jgi:hypothetical protein